MQYTGSGQPGGGTFSPEQAAAGAAAWINNGAVRRVLEAMFRRKTDQPPRDSDAPDAGDGRLGRSNRGAKTEGPAQSRIAETMTDAESESFHTLARIERDGGEVVGGGAEPAGAGEETTILTVLTAADRMHCSEEDAEDTDRGIRIADRSDPGKDDGRHPKDVRADVPTGEPGAHRAYGGAVDAGDRLAAAVQRRRNAVPSRDGAGRALPIGAPGGGTARRTGGRKERRRAREGDQCRRPQRGGTRRTAR